MLWVLLPYVALTSFVLGHVWRYRRDGYRWTARSTEASPSTWGSWA